MRADIGENTTSTGQSVGLGHVLINRAAADQGAMSVSLAAARKRTSPEVLVVL